MEDGVASSELGNDRLMGLARDFSRLFVARDLQRQGIDFARTFGVIHFDQGVPRGIGSFGNSRIIEDPQIANGTRL